MRTLRVTTTAGLVAVLLLSACDRSAAPVTTPASAERAPANPSAVVQRPSKQYAIEDFVETIGVAGASFSPDESRILFSSNKSGIWNAYTMAASGGEWTPVTQSTTDNNNAVAWFLPTIAS